MGVKGCKLTAAEFITWELDRPGRHEFFRGEARDVFGGLGAHRDHVTVMGNIGAYLRGHLITPGCQAFMAQMRLAVEATGDLLYPDILVTCDPCDLAASLEMQHPKLIIEVLSPSTAAFDRGDKFLTYRQIPELEEYALVDPLKKTFEVYRRQANGRDWLLTPGRAGDGLVLQSVELTIPASLLFENV